ncbi:MAG: hypothetical protein ABSA84_06290 [Gammaproteobacteria bacterium]
MQKDGGIFATCLNLDEYINFMEKARAYLLGPGIIESLSLTEDEKRIFSNACITSFDYCSLVEQSIISLATKGKINLEYIEKNLIGLADGQHLFEINSVSPNTIEVQAREVPKKDYRKTYPVCLIEALLEKIKIKDKSGKEKEMLREFISEHGVQYKLEDLSSGKKSARQEAKEKKAKAAEDALKVAEAVKNAAVKPNDSVGVSNNESSTIMLAQPDTEEVLRLRQEIAQLREINEQQEKAKVTVHDKTAKSLVDVAVGTEKRSAEDHPYLVVARANVLFTFNNDEGELDDKACFMMVMSARDLSKSKKFTIDNCEHRPETAMKLFIIGKILGLTPVVDDKTNEVIKHYMPGSSSLLTSFKECYIKPNLQAVFIHYNYSINPTAYLAP